MGRGRRSGRRSRAKSSGAREKVDKERSGMVKLISIPETNDPRENEGEGSSKDSSNLDLHPDLKNFYGCGGYIWRVKCLKCNIFTSLRERSRLPVACRRCQTLLCEPTEGEVVFTKDCFPFPAFPEDEAKCRICGELTTIVRPLQSVKCCKCSTVLYDAILRQLSPTHACMPFYENGLVEGGHCRICSTFTRIEHPDLPHVECWKCHTVLLESLGGKHHKTEYYEFPYPPDEIYGNDTKLEFAAKKDLPPGTLMELQCALCMTW